MHMHARIELFGGPEDGREITIPVGPEGAPVSPLPVPSPGADIGSPEAVAWYRKDHCRAHGVWIFTHSNARSVQESAEGAVH